jgi:hypothetical protein
MYGVRYMLRAALCAVFLNELDSWYNALLCKLAVSFEFRTRTRVLAVTRAQVHTGHIRETCICMRSVNLLSWFMCMRRGDAVQTL